MTGKREAQLYQYLRLLKGATTATTTERQQQRRPRGGRRSKLIPTSIPTLLLIPVFPSNCPKISLLLVSPKLVSSRLVAAWIGLALLCLAQLGAPLCLGQYADDICDLRRIGPQSADGSSINSGE